MRLLDAIRQEVKLMDFDPSHFPGDQTKLFVADAIWASTVEVNKIWQARDFPNIAPPFDDFFIEGRIVAYVDNRPTDFYGGVWFRNRTETLKKTKTRVTPDQKYLSPFPDTHWIMECRGYCGNERSIGNHPGFFYLHIDKDGHWLDSTDNVPVHVAYDFSHYTADEMAERGIMPTNVTLDLIPFCLMTLSLLHCRNVEIEEIQAPRAERRRYERQTGGMATAVQHVLKIKQMGKRAAGEQRGSGEAQGLNRLHIVRGHFRTFPEPGLFGKWPGTYWWGDFSRGNPNRGQVEKVYEVEP